MQRSVIILLLIALLLAFSIGTQDETMVTTIASGSLGVKHAFMVGSTMIVLGSLFLSRQVGTTLGITLLAEEVQYTATMMHAVLIAGFLLLMLGAFTAVPVSLNQTIVGSIVGVVIIDSIRKAQVFHTQLNATEIGIVVGGWVVGPALAYVGSLGIEFGIQELVRKHNKCWLDMEKTEYVFRGFLVVFVTLNQISTAGNASGNALGMVYGLADNGSITGEMLGLMILGVAGIYLAGYLTFGRRLILRLRDSMGKLRPSDTIAIEISTSLIIFSATLAGIPVSGAQILIFAMLGAGRMRGQNPEKGMIKRMMTTWLVLLPLSIGLAAGIYLLLV